MKTIKITGIAIVCYFACWCGVALAGEWRYSAAPHRAPAAQAAPSKPMPPSDTVSDSMETSGVDSAIAMVEVQRPLPFHDMPTNNMENDVVKIRYGEPESQAVPVGIPPISRWYYPVYTVYFEYDRVLTSVVNDQQ